MIYRIGQGKPNFNLPDVIILKIKPQLALREDWCNSKISGAWEVWGFYSIVKLGTYNTQTNDGRHLNYKQ